MKKLLVVFFYWDCLPTAQDSTLKFLGGDLVTKQYIFTEYETSYYILVLPTWNSFDVSYSAVINGVQCKDPQWDENKTVIIG